MAGGERNADGAVVPEVDVTGLFEESVAIAPEADNVFDADNGVAGTVSVRVEDSLDDGELVDRLLACRELSEDARDRLGLGTLGNGSAGGGELEPSPTRLVSVEAAVDGDLEGFGGDVDVGTDDDRVVVAEEPGKLAPIDDPAAVALSIRESEAERALSLEGAATLESWALACPEGLIGDVGAAFGTTSHDACFVLFPAVPGSGCFPPGVSGGFKVGGLVRFADE